MVGASLVPVTVTVTSWSTRAAVAVVDRDGERLGRGLADRQVLRGAVGDLVGPGRPCPARWPAVSLAAPSVSVPPQRAAASGRDQLVAVCTSIRSTSLKAIVPVSRQRRSRPQSSVTAPAASSAPLMVGASLVPVTVTVTSCEAVPPWPSLTVTVNVSVAVWPTARYCVRAVGDLVGPADGAGAVAGGALAHRAQRAACRRACSPVAGRPRWPVCTSIRSTSLKAIVPVSLQRRSRAASSVTAPTASVSAAVMVGASLVPVIVIVTFCVTYWPSSSMILTTKTSAASLTSGQ